MGSVSQPVLSVREGDKVMFEVNDVSTWQMIEDTTSQGPKRIDDSKYYPLTGPVCVEGANPGDALVVETLSVQVADFGWSGR